MSDRFGFWNKILHVDLTSQTTTIEEPGDEFFRLYGGGRGMIAHYLLKHAPAGIDAYDPQNVLVFAPGVMTGAPVPGAGRHTVGAKSPLTNAYGEAEAGGFWGAEVKRAGWDGIVVHGKAEKPVYVWMTEDTVEIRDASHLWGLETGPVEEAIREELDDQRIRVAQCGPAGENLVRFANICNDLNEFAGRTGLGAVMGSKNLKAIAVRGGTPVPLADKSKLTEVAKWVSGTMMENHRAFHEYGTGAAMQGKNLDGGMPTLNYRLGEFEGIEKIDAIAVANEVRIDMGACYACSVRCKKVVQIEQFDEGKTTKKGEPVAVDPLNRYSVDPKYGGPEYESLGALGPSLGIDDLIAVCKSNEACNRLGMDTISAGATLAWAMEAWEKGILTAEDTGGVEIKFHDADGVITLLDMIARREGIGDKLAEGSLRMSQELGRGSDEFLTTVKGLELAMHDPRHMERMRESYIMAPTGGDHMQQQGPRNGLRNSVGLCHFLAYNDEVTLDLLNAITGWGMTQEDALVMARRGITLARLFNLREGITADDDTLPQRFREPLPKHSGIDLEEIMSIRSNYYVNQGWDPTTGVPTEETVKALGIEDDAKGAELALA
jgi:aldehyde:ferredoxin oxidoreductase